MESPQITTKSLESQLDAIKTPGLKNIVMGHCEAMANAESFISLRKPLFRNALDWLNSVDFSSETCGNDYVIIHSIFKSVYWKTAIRLLSAGHINKPNQK